MILVAEKRRYVKQCDPEEWLPAGDARYVELDEDSVRGSDHRSCVDALLETVLVSEPTDQTCQLFSGFPGCGKTTELRRLEARLTADATSTKVVFIDFDEYVDRFTPLTITDVLRVLAHVLDRAATRAEGKDPDAEPGYLKRFWDFIARTDVDLNKLEFSAYGAKLAAELKNNPTFHKKAEEALALRFQQFADEARDAMTDAVVRLRKAARVERIVVIADSLEKMTPLREEDRDSMEGSVETVFLQHAALLRIPCHVIYTFPLWLRFRTAGLGGRYDGEPLVLPMVKIADQAGGPYRAGLDKLVELVRRRIDLDKVFGPSSERTLLLLLQASGGYPRDLVRLVRELIMRARSFPVDEALANRIVDALAESYDLVVRAHNIDLLCEVARTHAPPASGDAKEIAAFGRLVERWLVLAYRNGREWFDVHPMVRRSRLVEERLRAKKAT